MQDRHSTRQVALALGVSEATVKRWCDSGKLPAEKTPGGHRRIPLASLVSYLRQHGHEGADLKALGLPAVVSSTDLSFRRAVEQMIDALVRGDERAVVSTGLGLFLSNAGVTDICDRVIARAFHALGDRWDHGDIEIYQERRGCEMTLSLLHRLRESLEAIGPDAPVAVGGTLIDDPYVLPSAMVELALREQGWRATNLGIGLPVETLVAAIQELRPRLFWLSVSTIGDVLGFRRVCDQLHGMCLELGTAFVVGGRALTMEHRTAISYTTYCENLRRLISFAEALEPRDAS